DPWQNISGGTRHLRDLMDEFDDLRLSLAAYNAGATPVRRLNNVPPYRETRDYVNKVLAVYRAGSRMSITMAGRTHSIGAPGGTIQITRSAAAPKQAAANENGAPLPAAAQASSVSGPATIAEDVALAVLPPPVLPPGTGPLYYRYRDELGVIYISRTKPSDVEYEVLEP
ncbi:MAG TPA: lytic transglycosylase domain-containing protein, partial [Vicinamibacteria bacterium]